MGPNKTDKAIDRSSRASGGERLTVQNFDHQVGKTNPTSSRSHKSFSIIFQFKKKLNNTDSKLRNLLPPHNPKHYNSQKGKPVQSLF